MAKTILLTGSTDGIGLVTAEMLLTEGHTVLLHGRNPQKLSEVVAKLADVPGGGAIETYVADLSIMAEVEKLAAEVAQKHNALDVIINNAGVYAVSETVSADGLDIRFAVNTIAPYLLTKRLLPLLGTHSRVVNLSSAAQAPVIPDELAAPSRLPDGSVYAQSKLALTMWTNHMASTTGAEGPLFVSVNPRSMLGSKMVMEAYGVRGSDLRIGGDILCRAALSEEFENASGKYFDNDSGRFTNPHPQAMNAGKCEQVATVLESIIAKFSR